MAEDKLIIFPHNFDDPMEKRINDALASFAETKHQGNWDNALFRTCRLVSCEPGKAVFELTVTRNMLNRAGNLHGGCAATIGDMLSSFAFITVARPGYMDGGHVSRTLSCTYLRPAKEGNVLQIHCTVVAVGKSMAHATADFTLDGKMVVAVSHDKAILQPAKAKL